MFYFVAFALAQAAPPSTVPPSIPSLSTDEAVRIVVSGMGKHEKAEKLVNGLSDNQVRAALEGSLSGKTKLIYQSGHGVFVEHMAPDGQLRMWYPKNSRVVKGSWGVRTVKKKLRACFSYNDSINPVTKVYEPTECVAPAQVLSGENLIRSWDGDPFGLMADRIPYQKGNLDMPSPELLPAVGAGE